MESAFRQNFQYPCKYLLTKQESVCNIFLVKYVFQFKLAYLPKQRKEVKKRQAIPAVKWGFIFFYKEVIEGGNSHTGALETRMPHPISGNLLKANSHKVYLLWRRERWRSNRDMHGLNENTLHLVFRISKLASLNKTPIA